MYYADWVGGDIQFKWLSNTQCPTYMVDTCSPSSWNRDDARIIEYKNIARRGTWTITEAEWTSWANRMDPDGYIYLRIVPSTSTNANMVITSSAPEEKDPVYPAMSIAVSCDESGNAYFRVSEDQHVVILEGTTEKQSFDAVVGQTYSISDLPAGTYTLRGQNDEIELKL